jgi:hypothetical protein
MKYIKMENFKIPNMVEPLKSNRYIIQTEGVHIPEYLFRRFSLENIDDDFVLSTEIYNTVDFMFNPEDAFKIIKIYIKNLDPIGVVVSTLEMEVGGINVEINGDYSDDNLMLTKFRFIINRNTMKVTYAK